MMQVAEAAQSQVAEGRKGDGYLIVVQDNASRQLLIDAVNAEAAALLDYPADELKGRKLEVVLGNRTALVIDEDLEYADDAPDMADVLSRTRELRLRKRTGEEFAVPTTINRVMAEDRNPRFQLILPNEREGRAREQWRDLLKASLDGQTEIDQATALPNRATAEAYLRTVSRYMGEGQFEAAFVVLRLDRYEKSLARYGVNGVNQLVQHVANCCRATFRSEDVICQVAPDKLGLLLIDISRESVRLVLNRLRWNIRTHTIHFGGKADFASTVCIAFDMLTPDNAEQVLATAEQAVEALDADVRNSLLEPAQ